MLRVHGRDHRCVRIEIEHGVAVELPARPHVRVEIYSQLMLDESLAGFVVEFRAVDDDRQWQVTVGNPNSLPWSTNTSGDTDKLPVVSVDIAQADVRVFGRLDENEPERVLLRVSQDNTIELPAFVRLEPLADVVEG